MTVTSNLPLFSLIAAVFIFGDYPQNPWDKAMENLAEKVRTVAKSNEISPTSLWILGRATFGKDYRFL